MHLRNALPIMYKRYQSDRKDYLKDGLSVQHIMQTATNIK